MKKIITIVLLLLAVVACKKENNNRVNESTNKTFLTVKIDGVNHSFSDKVKLGRTSELSHIINAYNSEDKTRITLGLNIKNNTTGTFKLSDHSDMVLVYHSHLIYMEKRMRYLWHAKDDTKGSTGTITITKNNDTYIEGTFTFKGVGATKIDTSVKSFTEGKFRILKN